MIAGRAEPHTSEIDSLTIFFKKDGDHYLPQPHPVFRLQDPSVTKINGEIILCGIEVEVVTLSRFQQLIQGKKEDRKILFYKTVFYKGDSIENLTRFAEGPKGMKDIRLVKLTDGTIGVYARPQGDNKGGRGQIGFTIIKDLSELSEELIQAAPLLSTRFPAKEWGGVNEAIPLPNGRVLALGHRAYYDNHEVRHYYPWAFVHDPKTGEVIDLGILAERSDFPEGLSKRTDLADVLFSAGMKLLPNGHILLKVGMGDAEAGEMERDNPLVRP